MKTLIQKLDKFEWFLLMAAVLVHLYIAAQNTATILDWFNTDDAFYYFVPARNIARGLGVTFDGISTTNGFHPLWLLLNVPVFALFGGDAVQPLRAVIVILGLLHGGSAVLLYRLLKGAVRMEAAWLGAFLWMFSPAIHSLTAKGGVESGVNAFFILFFWYRLADLKRENDERGASWKRYLPTGVLALLAVFSRLDNIFLVFWGGAWLLLGELRRLFSKTTWKDAFEKSAAFGFPSAAGLGLYMLWNKLAVGSWMPLSGSIKSWWGNLPFTVYGTAEFKHGPFSAWVNHTFSSDANWGPWSLVMTPIQTIGSWLGPLVPTRALYSGIEPRVYAASGMVLLIVLALIWGGRRVALPAAAQLGLVPLFLAAVSHTGYYNLRVSLAQRYWYWVLENFLLVVTGAVLLAAVFEIAKRLATSTELLLRILQVVTALAGVGLFWLYSEDIQGSLRAPGAEAEHFYLARASWIEAHTPEEARIAITGAGALSYFTTGRTIVNMDGLMNSGEYFRLLQAGRGADFLESIGVDYVFGSQAVVQGSSPYAQMLKDKLVEVDRFIDGEREIVLWDFSP